MNCWGLICLSQRGRSWSEKQRRLANITWWFDGLSNTYPGRFINSTTGEIVERCGICGAVMCDVGMSTFGENRLNGRLRGRWKYVSASRHKLTPVTPSKFKLKPNQPTPAVLTNQTYIHRHCNCITYLLHVTQHSNIQQRTLSEYFTFKLAWR